MDVQFVPFQPYPMEFVLTPFAGLNPPEVGTDVGASTMTWYNAPDGVGIGVGALLKLALLATLQEIMPYIEPAVSV